MSSEVDEWTACSKEDNTAMMEAEGTKKDGDVASVSLLDEMTSDATNFVERSLVTAATVIFSYETRFTIDRLTMKESFKSSEILKVKSWIFHTTTMDTGQKTASGFELPPELARRMSELRRCSLSDGGMSSMDQIVKSPI